MASQSNLWEILRCHLTFALTRHAPVTMAPRNHIGVGLDTHSSLSWIPRLALWTAWAPFTRRILEGFVVMVWDVFTDPECSCYGEDRQCPLFGYPRLIWKPLVCVYSIFIPYLDNTGNLQSQPLVLSVFKLSPTGNRSPYLFFSMFPISVLEGRPLLLCCERWQAPPAPVLIAHSLAYLV